MYIVHVSIRVKPDVLDEFIKATLENAANSLLEPGVSRFDVIQQADDPSRFVLLEAYHTQEDALLHKQTPHYEKWRTVAEPMMIEPRTRIVYTNTYPSDADW
jgi:(4S)-4-hydroxy-5-phosphonooxypentane-2,3-dione isomerase